MSTIVDKDILKAEVRAKELDERRLYEGHGQWMCSACGYCVSDRLDDDARVRPCPRCAHGTTGRGWEHCETRSYADRVSGVVKELRDAGVAVR